MQARAVRAGSTPATPSCICRRRDRNTAARRIRTGLPDPARRRPPCAFACRIPFERLTLIPSFVHLSGMAKTIFRQETLASPTGAGINLYSSTADGDPAGVVQVNHGLAEHAARYARFARFLKPHGIHLFAHDHRGHGATTAPDAPAGVFAPRDGVEKILADVDAVHDLIAERHPGLPVICFGHSMGGLIALNHALDNSGRLAGLACWNANFSAGIPGRVGRSLLAWERLRLGYDVPSRLAPALTFRAWAKAMPDRVTDFDWISRDREEVAKYVADPLCGRDASVSMWQDVFGLIFRGADDGNFNAMRRDLPVSLVGGGKDPATGGGAATRKLFRRMRRMGFQKLDIKVYEDARHESLNEINRQTVMADFLAWTGNCIAPKS